MIPHDIARQFLEQDEPVNIIPYGNGLINDTWRITANTQQFILQKINPTVFPNPELIMANLEAMTEHLKHYPEEIVKLQFPEILKAGEQSYFIDDASGFWRALSFINNTESIETLRTLADAEQVGFALGHFHRLLSNLSPDCMYDTLPGFHIAPDYLEHYHQVLELNTPVKQDKEVIFCHNFIARHKQLAGMLENAKLQGLLTLRIIHGDPKLNNILFDRSNHKAISIIDLDTIQPGLVHYDIGDCLRSCCSIPTDGEYSVHFDMDICATLLQSYLSEARAFFTLQDYHFLYVAIQLIPLELGLRFFTDYLEGNLYFKVTEPEQNLHRALTQFQLMESITRQQPAIQKLINSLQPQ